MGKGFDPIVEGGMDKIGFLPVVVDQGEAEGGFEAWEEFACPDELTSPPLPNSFRAMGCGVKNSELGACIGWHTTSLGVPKVRESVSVFLGTSSHMRYSTFVLLLCAKALLRVPSFLPFLPRA